MSLEYAIISENWMSSPASFTCVDERESLYSTNQFQPTSSVGPIKWQDSNLPIRYLHPIVSIGDMCVSKELAEIIMSFDPYGIEVYPMSLEMNDGVVDDRYLLAINNVQDVADLEKSVTEISPYSGDLIIHKLFLDEAKLAQIPFAKRIVYRDKIADSVVFFAPEIYDLIADDKRFQQVRKMKKDISMRAPKL